MSPILLTEAERTTDNHTEKESFLFRGGPRRPVSMGRGKKSGRGVKGIFQLSFELRSLIFVKKKEVTLKGTVKR